MTYKELANEPTEGITLSKLQMEMLVWQGHNFPDRQEHIPLLGVGEELGKLNHAFIKTAQGIRTNENHKEKMVDAVADLMIFLADFCNSQGIVMQEALDKTWSQVRLRDWQKDKETGNANS